MTLPAFILECVCVLHVHICRLTAFLKCCGIKRNIYLRLLSHGHALVTDPFYCMCVRLKKNKGEGGERRWLVLWKIIVYTPACWEPSVLRAC